MSGTLWDRNDVCRTPFAVIADHEMRTVVIAIRGTISLKDCVTGQWPVVMLVVVHGASGRAIASGQWPCE